MTMHAAYFGKLRLAADLFAECIGWERRLGFLDNIFVERLWRSLKYGCVYLHA